MGSVPVDLLDHKISSPDAFDLPRIDAVDIANSPDERNWSVVVSESFNTPIQQDLIFTTYGLYNLSLNNRYLNNNSIAPNESLDISIPSGSTYSSYFYNKRPVVAFSQEKDEMYYGWCFRDDDYINNWYSFPQFQKSNYISLKLRIDGTILNDWNTGFLIYNNPTLGWGIRNFAKINFNNTISNNGLYPRRAMAFSTENASSPQLFTAFFQTEPADEHNYFIAQKTTDWSTANFRPAPHGEVGNTISTISVYPNPTKGYFVLNGSGEEVYDMQLVNITGKVITNQNGTIKQINSQLKGLQLANGNYLIQVINTEGKSQKLKVVKQ